MMVETSRGSVRREASRREPRGFASRRSACSAALLTPGSRRDVYATIAYYLEHEAAVQEYLKGRGEAASALRREIEERQGGGLGARLRARRSNLAQS
jgi:hypothetical protein